MTTSSPTPNKLVFEFLTTDGLLFVECPHSKLEIIPCLKVFVEWSWPGSHGSWHRCEKFPFVVLRIKFSLKHIETVTRYLYWATRPQSTLALTNINLKVSPSGKDGCLHWGSKAAASTSVPSPYHLDFLDATSSPRFGS